MERINDDKQLMLILGGFSLTGTIVNAFLSVGKFIYPLGPSFGTSRRRIGSNNICKV